MLSEANLRPLRFGSLFLMVLASSSADECKLWDFKATTAGDLSGLIDLATWDGGTQAQCEATRSRLDKSLKAKYTSASNRWHQMVLKNTGDKSGTLEDRLQRVKEESKAKTTRDQAFRDWRELPLCTCVARAETALEKRIREQQEHDALIHRKKSEDPNRKQSADPSVKTGDRKASNDGTKTSKTASPPSKEQAADADPNGLPITASNAPLGVVEPFGGRESSLRSADAPGLAEPFPKQDEKEDDLVSAATKELALSTAVKVFEELAKRATQTLANDARVVAAKLPKAKAVEYIRSTNDVISYFKGFESVFKHYDTAIGVGKIVSAETSDDRALAAWDLGNKLAQDAAKNAATWSIELLPKRAASVLLGPVAWGGSILLSSETTAIEPSDVLQRPQDYSSEQKKETLYRQARLYDKYGDKWPETARTEFLRLRLVVEGATEQK